MLTHKGTQTIKTDRLILRRFEFNDVYDMFKNWANDDEVTRFLSWQPHESLEVTKDIVKDWINNYTYHNNYNWAIELKDFEEVIGSISVVELNEKHYSCEIGYCMSRKYWSKGIMTEALKTVIAYLFTEVGMNRITAKHDTNNPASGKVMTKSGMLLEGTMRQAKMRTNQGFYDLALYAILKDDWSKE